MIVKPTNRDDSWFVESCKMHLWQLWHMKHMCPITFNLLNSCHPNQHAGSSGNFFLRVLMPTFKCVPYRSYLSVTPPNGGEITLAKHPKAWEEWEMQKVGDKVAFKSFHGTYLSTK